MGVAQRDGMTEPGRWNRMIPEVIATLPESPGVFEVANLVRTVLFVGHAEGAMRRHLTVLLQQAQTRLPPAVGGYFFRYELTTDEEPRVAERLASYRATHGDSLPPGNCGPIPPLRLAHSRAA
jgi:hypothetical protein